MRKKMQSCPYTAMKIELQFLSNFAKNYYTVFEVEEIVLLQNKIPTRHYYS